MVDAGTYMGLGWNILPQVMRILQTHHFESVPSFVSYIQSLFWSEDLTSSICNKKAPKELLKSEAESFLF